MVVLRLAVDCEARGKLGVYSVLESMKELAASLEPLVHGHFRRAKQWLIVLVATPWFCGGQPHASFGSLAQMSMAVLVHPDKLSGPTKKKICCSFVWRSSALPSTKRRTTCFA